MYLNSIKPADGAKKNKTRVGRGIGSGFGKTCGRGHKGQKSRAGGFHKVGFEGGQMPIQRRLPKRGFTTLSNRRYHRLRFSELNTLQDAEINIMLLKKHNIIPDSAKKVKIYKSGSFERRINLEGIAVTCGVKKAIEMAGGTIS
ncbi:50S ribosomal protein L15 [Nitrosomonas sp. Nm166]|uniref:50S ribosomal protein L15 n=1 Tax=Nitrosomonas sp. Nm166 TaxID=1881054 RepID=UPI0008E9AB32|nr:50S ribosomal protein L15 [Nitrosomonas sp. Nm166]SFE87822.1 large subunit ribosomal protein L15 [Nitrosomonas sp. Nm166]